MPRQFSAALTALLATNQAKSVVTLDLTAGAASWHVATHRLTANGFDYLPYLKWSQPLTRTRGLKLDRVTVEVNNVNLWWTGLTRDFVLEGATGRLSRYYPDLGESVILFDGKASGHQTGYRTAEIELVQALDPGKQTIPLFSYTPFCRLRFKSPECGYDPLGPLADCAKTLAACQERERIVSFRGFPTLTRETQESVPPPPAPPVLGNEFDLEVEIYGC